MKKTLPYFFLFPAFLFLLVFTLFPAAQTFWMSFRDIDPFSQGSLFVGLENYQEFFSLKSLGVLSNTFQFVLLTVIPSVLLSLGLSILLDKNPLFRNLFRFIFVFPVALSSAMAAMLWIFIFNPSSGYLNFVISHLGITGLRWLIDPESALFSIAAVTVWKEIGFNIIFFMAGLSTIPRELLEASELDGASSFQRFFFITLPLLYPTVLFVTLVSTIHAFESFGQIHILTEGGPANSTTTLVYRLYRDAFYNFRSGLASVEAVILFFIVGGISYLQFSLSKRQKKSA